MSYRDEAPGEDSPSGSFVPLARRVGLVVAGILAVFVLLVWDFGVAAMLGDGTESLPRVGHVVYRAIYAPSTVTVTLPSGGPNVELLAGEKIVGQGQRLTADHVVLIRASRQAAGLKNLSPVWGYLVITLLIASLLLVHMFQLERRPDETTHEFLLVSVVLGVLALSKLAVAYATDADLLYLINPGPVGLILVSVFASADLAIVVGLLQSVLLGLIYAGHGPVAQVNLVIYNLLGGMTAIYACSAKQSERWDILRAGMAVSLVNVVTLLATNLLGQHRSDPVTFTATFDNVTFGMANGIFCAMLVLGVMPFLEDLFHVTTSTRLLELTNPNHPLLQRLVTEAPGTFHHSMNVAHLSEKAAEAIGADPYLCKAASYYHDLGKCVRPYYFIENQMGGPNQHDVLSPQLSKLIIHSHTKDGVEIGRKYGLPKVITDIMVQHHGTDLVAFFYHRARQAESEGEPVDEQFFRYPGVKPQTKEAVIIMLADAAEAATRTLKKPTPQAIENLINKIINDKFVDGQFDESDVTKRDFELISDSFTRTLAGMYHARIQYPSDLAARAGESPQIVKSMRGDAPPAAVATPDSVRPPVTETTAAVPPPVASGPTPGPTGGSPS